MLTRISNNWKSYSLIVIFFFFFKSLYSQQAALPKPTSIDQVPVLLNQVDTSTAIGYGAYQKKAISGAVTTISNDNFNKGLISDPLLLIQGKVAGLQVYNRGGDPNLESISRIRGLSAYAQSTPLIVIDGVPGAALQNLDPNDIASITVLKDGSSQAIYGIRASTGVLLITTKTGLYQTDTFTIAYQGQFGISNPYPGISVTDAAEFSAVGGVDFGSSTNWLDEVQQSGLSNTHGLALQGRKGKSNYRISGNYRSVQGVLRKSGFDQLNIRGNFSTKLLHEKLSIHLSAAYTDRSSELGFNEAFRYATSYNPTFPVLAQDAPFSFNTEQFGGFFETIGLFDSYNPKAIVELNDRKAKSEALTTSALLEYSISSSLSLSFRHAYQDQFSNERAFYSPQSLFRGNAYGPLEENKGRADLNDYEDSFSLYELFGSFDKTFGKSKLGFILGTAYQDGNQLDNYLRLDGFKNESLLDTRRIEDYANWENEALNTDSNIYGWSDKLSAFFGRVHFNVRDKLFLNASLRYEGSSKLGENNRWGTFPALGMALDLKKLWNIRLIDELKIRTGYGVTGALPRRGGLSQPKILRIEQVDGSIIETTKEQANPNLKWEQKNETNIGLDYRFGKLNGFVDWYSRNVSDWIRIGSFEIGKQYANQNSLESTGLELGLEVPLIDNSNFSYTTGIIFSSYRSKYMNYEPDQSFAIGPGGAIINPIYPIREGDEIGNIVGPYFTGNVVNGVPVFTDINEDGQILIGTESVFEPDGDFAILGNGLPDYELGWNHQFRFRGWQLAAFFRGAFGHSLVNINRMFYEAETSFGNGLYNRVNTELAIDNLSIALFSSLYVEDASFLKLDNLSLSKTFNFGAQGRNKQLNISLTGQNLFVITNYTGADPEPALVDVGSTTNSSLQRNVEDATPLAPGIDRRNYYLPARTFVLGIRFVF